MFIFHSCFKTIQENCLEFKLNWKSQAFIVLLFDTFFKQRKMVHTADLYNVCMLILCVWELELNVAYYFYQLQFEC